MEEEEFEELAGDESDWHQSSEASSSFTAGHAPPASVSVLKLPKTVNKGASVPKQAAESALSILGHAVMTDPDLRKFAQAVRALLALVLKLCAPTSLNIQLQA